MKKLEGAKGLQARTGGRLARNRAGTKPKRVQDARSVSRGMVGGTAEREKEYEQRPLFVKHTTVLKVCMHSLFH